MEYHSQLLKKGGGAILNIIPDPRLERGVLYSCGFG